jgi:hypothetical protein
MKRLLIGSLIVSMLGCGASETLNKPVVIATPTPSVFSSVSSGGSTTHGFVHPGYPFWMFWHWGHSPSPTRFTNSSGFRNAARVSPPKQVRSQPSFSGSAKSVPRTAARPKSPSTFRSAPKMPSSSFRPTYRPTFRPSFSPARRR